MRGLVCVNVDPSAGSDVANLLLARYPLFTFSLFLGFLAFPGDSMQ